MSDFLNNSVRVYLIKLKLGMLDHKNNTFRNTVFEISVNVPLIFTQTIKPLILCASFRAYGRNFGSSLTYDDVINSFTDTWHIWRHKSLVYMARNISAKFHAIGLLFPDIWQGGTFLPPISNEDTKDPITNWVKYF